MADKRPPARKPTAGRPSGAKGKPPGRSAAKPPAKGAGKPGPGPKRSGGPKGARTGASGPKGRGAKPQPAAPKGTLPPGGPRAPAGGARVPRGNTQRLDEAERLKAEAKRLLQEAKRKGRRDESIKRHRERVSALAPRLGLDPRRPVTEFPPLPPNHTEMERQTVQEGFAYIRISMNERSHQPLYEVVEPRLENEEKEAYDFIRDTLIRTLGARTREDKGPEEVLQEAVEEVVADHSVLVDDIAMQRIWYHLVRDFLGYGPIDVMMRDPQIEDISCDGPDIPIFLFHRQYESMRTTVVFDESDLLDAFVIRLAQQSGKHISIADPMLDATLPDGSRLQATLAREVTTRGSSFTIRRFRDNPLTPADLAKFGTISAELAAYFWFLMEHGHSLLMAGGTASGKTTTLNAICQFIPPQKKIVSIEDTREINLSHENWIAGVTRTGFGSNVGGGERAGAIDMFNLLAAALRQRPEYLLVGEVRGKEALTLFQAMATGHAVYSTMHADSVSSAVYRLENEPINVPRMMLQTLDAFAIQAQVRVGDKMARRVMEVTELVGFDPESGDLLTNTVFTWDVVKDAHRFTGKSFMLDSIREMSNLSVDGLEAEWARRTKLIEAMRDAGMDDFREVSDTLQQYYQDPEKALATIEAKRRPTQKRTEGHEAAPGAGTIPPSPPMDGAAGAPTGRIIKMGSGAQPGPASPPAPSTAPQVPSGANTDAQSAEAAAETNGDTARELATAAKPPKEPEGKEKA